VRIRARAFDWSTMPGWWPVFFGMCWQVFADMPGRSKSLLQRNHHLSRQDPSAEDMSAERLMKEGAYEIKQLMAPGKTPVNIPALSHDHVPKSPPHRLEISDNDGTEVVDYWAAEASDVVNAKYVVAGMPMDFPGNSCKHVCTMCVIAAKQYPECGCRATCIAGSDDSQCSGKIYGWSNYDVSTPKTRWKAKCNAGAVDCNQCIDEEIKKKMAKCKKDPIPAICEHDLKMALAKGDTPIKYCTQDNTVGEGLATCDEFMYEPKENGWICFDKKAECEGSKTDIRESITAYEKTIPPLDTPCIWCNIPIKKTGDGKKG